MKTFKSKKVTAFTLAEVLITLGVIGVVSAMTIPVVIKNYQEHVTVNKVKKFYSMISQAFLLSVKDNGYADDWEVGNNRTPTTAIQIAKYIIPYLKIVKDCGIDSGCLNYTQVNSLDESHKETNYDRQTEYYKVILSDGSYMWIRSSLELYCHTNDVGLSNTCGLIGYDINGGKKPNTIGRDIFVFYITPNSIKTSPQICNLQSVGWGCAGYILQNGNMNYLH